MDITIEPGERNIKLSDKSFKFAAAKHFLGDMVSLVGIGERDANFYLVGEFLKFEANMALSAKGANICFEDNQTIIIYVVNYGNGLNIVEVEVESASENSNGKELNVVGVEEEGASENPKRFVKNRLK